MAHGLAAGIELMTAGTAATREESRRSAFANGVLCALIAASSLWGVFREFTPPPEEAKNVHALLEESEEVLRRIRERNALRDERSKITDAIDERIECSRPGRPRAEVPNVTRIQRLRATWFTEMEETTRLTDQQMKEREERKWQAGAQRREQVARAAWEWEHHRTRLLAMSASAWLLAGWLWWQALLKRHRQAVTSAAVEAGAPPLTADRAAVEPLVPDGRRGGTR